MVSSTFLCPFYTSKTGTLVFLGHSCLEKVKLFLYLLRGRAANLLSLNKF